MHLDTLGIINGCIDSVCQSPGWAEMAYNNTYGIEVIDKTAYETMMHEWNRPNGCKENNVKCHEMAKKSDPRDLGDVEKVNAICIQASNCTANTFIVPYMETDVCILKSSISCMCMKPLSSLQLPLVLYS